MSIVTYENVDTPVFEIDFLRYLFANGAQGSVWGLLPYYNDAAGTVEADWGDPVGNIPDASGNGTAWAQVTSTARPILGRVPVGGRRNLLTWTEDFSNPLWTSDGASITPQEDGTVIIVESSGNEAHRLTRLPYGSPPLIQGELYTFSAEARIHSGSRNVRFTSGNNSIINISAIFNLSSGEVVTGDGANIVPLDDNWFRLEVTRAPAVDGFPVLYLCQLVDGSAGVYEGDGESGIEFRKPDVRLASLDGPYQRVGNDYDITEAGVKGIHYLRFDGTDDAVTTTLPAISGGTIVLAGTNGIWIDSLDFAGGEFSVGPDTYTGGPAGLMSILGDILVEGGFVIDRALTPEEIAKVKKYYKARGSAGLIELGPELVVNGTFDSDLSGWTSMLATWEGGRARLVGVATGDTPYVRQTAPFDVGATYLMSVDAEVFSKGFYVSIGNNTAPESRLNVVTTGRHRAVLVAGSVVSYLQAIRLSSPCDFTVDNFSFRKLELIP